MNSTEAHRRAAALFKKEQQSREAERALADYQSELHTMREKTAQLRALRLARDAANQGGLPRRSRPGAGSVEPNTRRQVPTERASR
jgi:hypothetical protein